MKLISLFVFLLFLGKSYLFLDPDFGWHLRLGKIISSSGVPAADPFSYTMPSYLFVDHEWFGNLISYFSYQFIGWTGLAIIFSFIATLALILPFLVRPRKYNFLPIILGAGFLVVFVGIRMQVVTLLFFSILITVFFTKRYYEKFKYFLPFLFLAWVNLHGGFAMGIGVYALYLLVDFIKTKKVNLIDWSIFLISFLATFVNPYGWRIWQEIWITSSDASLRWAIGEWIPVFLNYNPILWIIIVFSSYLIIKYRDSFSLFEKLLFFGLLTAGFLSVRHMAIWVIMALPLMHKGILVLDKNVGKIKHGKERMKKAYSILTGLMVVFVLATYFLGVRQWYVLGKNNTYPEKAVEYISVSSADGQIFSTYDWGGYFIWKLPDKKVFVDGRMPSWRKNEAQLNETKNAYQEYRKVIEGEIDFSRTADKYGIKTVVLPKEADQLLKLRDKTEFGSIYSQLEKNDWKIIYEDDVALIYKKTNE